MEGLIEKYMKGYSVLELIIAIALVAVIAISATQLMMTSINNTGKASGLAAVKQSGDHAIQYIERQIRQAKDASCPDPPNNNILTITDLDNNSVKFKISNDGVKDRLAYDAVGIVFLTAADLLAENFQCAVVEGTSGEPTIVEVKFELSLAKGGKPSESVTESFETRTSLRIY